VHFATAQETLHVKVALFPGDSNQAELHPLYRQAVPGMEEPSDHVLTLSRVSLLYKIEPGLVHPG
jgi:hypothetical protein